MEKIAVGQIWQFNSDSTLVVKENGQIISDGTERIGISGRDSTIIVKTGASVLEISNLGAKSMDVKVKSDLDVSMHFEKKW